MFKYGVISGPYFPVFSPNAGKYRPETIPYLDTFHARIVRQLRTFLDSEKLVSRNKPLHDLKSLCDNNC